MKKALLLTVGLSMIFVAGAAFGQAGHVQPYADAAYTECNAAGPVGLLTVYVVHELTAGTKASQYMLANNSGGALFYLADQNNYQVIGNANAGIAVSYGACLAGPIEAQRVLYQVLFAPAACSSLDVVPDPGALSGQIEGVSCSDTSTFPTGGTLTLNGGTQCPCQAVPVEETNWGQIKSLYN